MITNKHIHLDIALDYDHTYTADPELWDKFIEQAQLFGHDVHIVTMRYPEEQVRHDVPVGCEVHYTSRQGKRRFMQNIGREFDIWIDDLPEFILHSTNEALWPEEAAAEFRCATPDCNLPKRDKEHSHCVVCARRDGHHQVGKSERLEAENEALRAECLRLEGMQEQLRISIETASLLEQQIHDHKNDLHMVGFELGELLEHHNLETADGRPLMPPDIEAKIIALKEGCDMAAEALGPTEPYLVTPEYATRGEKHEDTDE